jgi:hypothetical protein
VSLTIFCRHLSVRAVARIGPRPDRISRTREAAQGVFILGESLPIPFGARRRPRRHSTRAGCGSRPAFDSEFVLRSSHQKRIVVSDALRVAPTSNAFWLNGDRDSSKISRSSPLATGKPRATVSRSSGGLVSGLRSHGGPARELLFVEITSNWRRSSCVRRWA